MADLVVDSARRTVQILVFVFQSAESARSVQRSEELNANAQTTLDKIEASSAAAQRVLFEQFNRMLDFIVGERSAVTGSAVDDAIEVAGDVEPDVARSATVADISRVVDAIRRAARPIFEVAKPKPGDSAPPLESPLMSSAAAAMRLSWQRARETDGKRFRRLVGRGRRQRRARASGEQSGRRPRAGGRRQGEASPARRRRQAAGSEVGST